MKGKSNPVAKYLRTFNKATVQRDRKKDAKKGASKYKKDIYKEEGDLAKARDNVGSDSCWDGYKATGTKKKGGKLVPDCKKESIGEGTDKLISSHVRGDINIKTVRRGTSMSSPIFVKVTDGKKTHEMGPYKSAAEAKAAVNKMHPAPKGKRTMESIDEGFSKAQIETLRKQFSTLNKVDPTGPAYKKMTKFLEGRSAKELEGIARAKIKFLSQTAASVLKSKHGVTIPFKDVYGESVEFNESISDLMEANLPINMLMPGLIDGSKSYKQAAKEIVKDAWRALTGKQKKVIAKVHKLTQTDDELGKLYRDGWKSGGTSMKTGARKAFDARVKELLPNEETRDYVAAWKSVKAKVQSSMKDQQNESVEQVDEASRKKMKIAGRDVVVVPVSGSKSEFYYEWKRKDGKKGYGEYDLDFDKSPMKLMAKEIKAQDKKDGTGSYGREFESVEQFGEAKKPVSQMTPKEKAANDKRRKEYNAYQKSKRNEGLSEGISVEQFDRLKSKQKVTIDFSSVMGGSGEKEFIVTRKSKLKGGKIEKITLKSVKNPMAQASYLYKRDGQGVSMAQGDMGVSVKSLKEGMRVEPYDVNALMEKAVEIQYTDKPDFGEDSALGYGRKEGYKEVGVIGTSARTAMVIFKLNAFDKKYTKSVRLKAGEEIFRYTSRGTVAGSIMPLIKVNMKRGLAYYLTQESSSGEIDEPVFETKSQKLKFIRLLTSAYKPGHIVKESVEQIDEVVAKLNKNGEIEMTKKKYAKVHRDFKGKWPDGEHYVTQHMGRQGMTQVPVKFVKEDVEQTDEGRILDKMRFKNKKEPNRGPSDYIKAGETHNIGGTKVKFTKAGNQGHIGYYWKKSNGKEGYEEYHPKRFKNHDEVKANIASEIKSQSKQRRESAEQVDEISRGLATRYVSKARSDIKNQDKKMDDVLATKRSKQGLAKFDKAARKQDNRFKGINRALPKMREDVEQVDEISDKLVKSYRAKAVQNLDNRLDKTTRKGNVSSRQLPAGRNKLAKSITKTKSNLNKAKTSVFGRDKKVAKAQASRDAAKSSFKDRKDNERKISNRDRGIARTDRKADAADKKKPGSAAKRGLRGFSGYGESVDQVDEKMDRETKRDVKTLIRLGDKPRLAIKTAKDNMSQGRSRLYTPKKQKDAYRKAYESVEQFDENQDIKATAPKAKATKVGQRATTPSDMGRKYPDNKWVVKKNTGTSKAYRPLEWVLESVEQVDELTQREKEMIADRKAKRDTKAGRKDKKTRLIPKTTTYVRPSKGEDDHIVMQLRKAQDSANFGNGEFDIRVSPVKGAATVQLKKPQIDKLLNVYDKLEKPDQKRKYRITLLKTLRSMQQKGK